MPARLARACLLLVACGHGAQPGAPDASDGTDGGSDGPDGPDLVPPQVVAIEPSGDAWLGEPVRVVFDEPIAVDGATATAMLNGAAVPATIALEGDRTIAVVVDATGAGTLEVTLAGTIRDLSANAAAVPIEAMLDVQPWSRPAVDRGVAARRPALAIGEHGTIYAAWTVGTPNRVVVARHAGAWVPLGGALGGAASSPSISLDAQGRPLVAWIENGTAYAARWLGGAWAMLPPPGNGSLVVLAGERVAVFGSTVQIRSLAANDTWTVVRDHAIAGGVRGAAFTGDAVAWLEASTIRAYDGATAMAPIGVVANHVALAARGDTLAIAWDEQAPSWNVVVAVADGASWSRLGGPLDIDVAGDASAPAVAIDSSNRVVVAWIERIEGTLRGPIARWGGARWTIVGNREWLATPAPPTQPALVNADAPVVAVSAGGELRVARHNGAGSPPGRASIAGCSFDAANPAPTLLSTGCFTLPAVAHPGLVQYDIVNELWTDGTKKRRWIGLPSGASMTANANESWSAPAGTIIVKEFAIETTPGNPATRRPVETRIFARIASGWSGFSYRWRTNGSDADLLVDGQSTFDWPLDGGGTYRHVYPSRSQCLSCHHTSYGPLLGIRPQQLARAFDYDGTIADQLATLAALGVGPSSSAVAFVPTHDRAASWEQRARSYVAANCAHCHNPDNIAIKDLRYTTPLAQTRLCEVIVPGSPSQSIVYARVTSRPGMPPLGTLAVDPLAEQLVGQWIAGMTSCP